MNNLKVQGMRALGNIFELEQRISQERRKALRAFKSAVESEIYPAKTELADISDSEYEEFFNLLETGKSNDAAKSSQAHLKVVRNVL